MQPPADDDDSTISLKPPPPTPATTPPRRVPVLAFVGGAGLLVVAAVGGWLLWPAAHPVAPPRIALQSAPAPIVQSPVTASPVPEPTPSPASSEAPAVTAPVEEAAVVPPLPETTRGFSERPPPSFRIETATEQRVLDHKTADGVTVFRFKPNPRILVLDFASLLEQGHMLNRAAAFVEKSGLPRDRLLSNVELDNAVRQSGDTVETFYYGHDYGTSALDRFFSLADRQNIHLTYEEESLHRLLEQDRWFEPNARAALISIPQVGANENVTWQARATILHHELSHGEYFTNSLYAAFVHHFWKQTLNEAEREQIRKHLASLGYDASQDELMENEAQAYLMFTENPEFFTPDMVGMTKGRLGELRTGFYRAMPIGWLRDSLGVTLGVNKTATAHPP